MSEQPKLINFNIGVVGHVDSGKTSLVKKLSQVGSTAAFDKSRQSQERGITLDLGFSSFVLDVPRIHDQSISIHGDSPRGKIQVTLVDCPGHASLIRTVIAAAQIIDLMILVVDLQKGIQTQTGECLILAEVVDNCNHLIVVINKVDLFPELSQRKQAVERLKKRILKVLETTKFKNSPIVSIAASPSNVTENSLDVGIKNISLSDVLPSVGLDDLLQTLREIVFIPKRTKTDLSELLIAADHCFSIRGQGTIVTGTVIQGSVRLNDTIEIADLKVQKIVKSMQMFKTPVSEASQGDRIAICVTQFDPKLLERGFISYPNLIKTVYAFVTIINRIKYFKESIKSKSKLHITLMHETVMGVITLFTRPANALSDTNSEPIPFDTDQEYEYLNELNSDTKSHEVFALIQLQGTISATNDSLLIASKLDTDINSNLCRIAFSGKVKKIFTNKDYREKELKEIKIFKWKSKEGMVERYSNEHEVIVRNMLKKETNMELFNGLKVYLSSGEEGIVDGSFGQSGKIKVRVPRGIKDNEDKSKLKKKDIKPISNQTETVKVILKFKLLIFEKNKKISQ